MRLRTLAVLGAAAGLWTAPAAAASFTMMFERTTDAGAGAEVAFRTYASQADLFTNTLSAPDTFSPINVSSVFNTTGLTWDGSQYIMMFERTTDAGAGAEVAFRTYASLADLFTNTLSAPDTFSPINVSGVFNTSGLAAEWDLGGNGGGNGGTTVPEPTALGLLGLGLAGLGLARRRPRRLA